MSVKKATINEKIVKLDALVKYFEQSTEGELNIDADLKKYEESMKLVDDIKQELESVELKINEIKEKYQ